MTGLDFIRLRGTVIAISVLFAIVALYLLIDDRKSSNDIINTSATTTTTTKTLTSTTVPTDSRVCGAAQRLIAALPKDQPSITKAMQAFYEEVAGYGNGDLSAEFAAAARYYKNVNDIAIKANWDVAAIVRNNDGERWKDLITSTPPGVEESRKGVRDLCRVNLPDAPLVELDDTGQIKDPRLAKLLEQKDKEILPETTTTVPAPTIPASTVPASTAPH